MHITLQQSDQNSSKPCYTLENLQKIAWARDFYASDVCGILHVIVKYLNGFQKNGEPLKRAAIDRKLG